MRQPTHPLSRLLPLALAALAPIAAGCDLAEDEAPLEEVAPGVEPVDDKGDHLSLPFSTFDDDIGTRGLGRTRKLLRSAAAYQSYFGHPAPPEVDFSRDWVFFYSAGTQPTGGYQARVLRMRRSSSGLTLTVTTQLESPGPDCVLTLALSRPYTLVSLPRQLAARYLRYLSSEVERDCAPIDPCAAVLCGPGTHCETVEVQCIMAPCDPVPQCVTDEPALEKCGAITCGSGQVCCNPSCGICTPADGACTQQVCDPL